MFSVNQYRSTRQSHTRGFNLLELMVAMAVASILLALAVPTYSNHMIRAKISECIMGAAPVKFAISEYHQTNGHWPPTLEATGEASAGISQFCTAIHTYESTTGAFTIDVNELAVDFSLVKISPIWTPSLTAGSVINWNCTVGETELDEIMYLPASCRDS